MRFGNLPQWAIELSNSIKEAVFVGHYLSESMNLPTHDKGKEAYPLPPELLWREPLFDQLIVNTYQPGEVRHTLNSIPLFAQEIGMNINLTHTHTHMYVCVCINSLHNSFPCLASSCLWFGFMMIVVIQPKAPWITAELPFLIKFFPFSGPLEFCSLGYYK